MAKKYKLKERYQKQKIWKSFAEKYNGIYTIVDKKKERQAVFVSDYLEPNNYEYNAIVTIEDEHGNREEFDTQDFFIFFEEVKGE